MTALTLGYLYSHTDIWDKNLPEALMVKSIFSNPKVKAFSFCVSIQRDGLCFPCGGIEVCLDMEEGFGPDGVRWITSVQALSKIQGASDVGLVVSNGALFNPYTFAEIWNDTHTDPDGPTDVKVIILPSGGIVMGLNDPENMMEMELGELEGNLEEDEDVSDFPAKKLYSIVVNKEKLTSGHQRLKVIEEMNTTLNELVKVMDTQDGMGFLAHVPWTLPNV